MSKKVANNGLRVVDVDDVEGGAEGLSDGVVAELAGIADAAREGLLAMSVTAGLQVMTTILENERSQVCGPMHAKLSGRAATRGGSTPSSVVLGEPEGVGATASGPLGRRRGGAAGVVGGVQRRGSAR